MFQNYNRKRNVFVFLRIFLWSLYFIFGVIDSRQGCHHDVDDDDNGGSIDNSWPLKETNAIDRKMMHSTVHWTFVVVVEGNVHYHHTIIIINSIGERDFDLEWKFCSCISEYIFFFRCRSFFFSCSWTSNKQMWLL